MKAHTFARNAAVIVAAGAAVLGFQATAQASGGPSTVYVSHDGTGGSACQHSNVHTIQGGVDQVRAGGTVVVCPGTYAESVSITKGLTLQGQRGAVVDATGQSYGIGIGADHVTVTGMTVHNAGKGLVPPDKAQATCGAGPTNPRCAGIVTFAVAGGPPVAGNYAAIVGNVVTENIGFGLDIVSTHDSLIKDNKANDNGVVGMNVVDDLGLPVLNNRILGNQTSDNATGCGIAMASHVGAGIVGNWVQGNTADGNGLAAGGAGILLATPVPNGIVRNNTLVDNEASGNGHSGIEVHFHPGTATVDGNSIVGNDIGRNNSLGDFADPHTTGIYVGSNSPLRIVLKDNHISNNLIAVFKAGPQVFVARSGNTYTNAPHRLWGNPTFG